MSPEEFFTKLEAATREELRAGRAKFFSDEEMDKAVEEAMAGLIEHLGHLASRL